MMRLAFAPGEMLATATGGYSTSDGMSHKREIQRWVYFEFARTRSYARTNERSRGARVSHGKRATAASPADGRSPEMRTLLTAMPSGLPSAPGAANVWETNRRSVSNGDPSTGTVCVSNRSGDA